MDSSVMTAKMERFRQMFLDECEEHISTLERTLPILQGGERSQELVDDAFRAAHSIKGGAGMVGFSRIVPFAHVLETVLDAVRTRDISISSDLASTMLRSVDCLADLILASGRGIDLPPNYEKPHALLLAEISGLNFGKAPNDGGTSTAKTAELGRTKWKIQFRPHTNLLRRANDPLLILRQLGTLGELKISADISRLPSFVDLDPTDCWLSWDIELDTAATEQAIRSAFEFVLDDCDLDIRPAGTLPLIADANFRGQAEGENFLTHGTMLGKSIRVDLDRIDKLVNLSGEIAISQALVSELVDQTLISEKPQLFQELSQLLLHIQNLQDSVMAIRAQPISTIFERMPRLVRELEQNTGKKLKLRMTGETTEIDKTVIEQLSDPIVHMIRNAADHGIESADVRLAVGKPIQGIIALSAEQRGSRIVIEVSDDGRGIDREAVRRRAITRNLISPNAELTLEETDALIFLPGFTTADNVSSISGRGVGMDVVKRNIQKLGGRINIRSEPGKGSTITLTLPLTLAVMDGMIVRSGAESYVLPVSGIVECRTTWRQESSTIPGTGPVMKVRGQFVKVMQLHEAFGTRIAGSADSSVAVIAEIEGGEQLAIVVDEIIGQQQVVIKSMTQNLRHVPGVAGATILGNGRVALIIDPSEMRDLPQKKLAARSIGVAADDLKRATA